MTNRVNLRCSALDWDRGMGALDFAQQGMGSVVLLCEMAACGGGLCAWGEKKGPKKRQTQSPCPNSDFLHADSCRLGLVACKNLRWDKGCKIVPFWSLFSPGTESSPQEMAVENAGSTLSADEVSSTQERHRAASVCGVWLRPTM